MKKIIKGIVIKKVVAIITTLSFIFTGVFGNAFASLGTTMPVIDNIKFESMLIPTSLGKITSAKYYDSDEIIINIQDLHCHAQTQRQISSIIGYIDNLYKLDKVYLEGAFNNVDTSWLSSFNNSTNGTKVLEGLVNSGKLSGTEYYSIINNKKNFVVGIEDEKLYKENIKLLGEIIKLQPEIDAICSQLTTEINKIKKSYTGRQARVLDSLITSFKDKKIEAKIYYREIENYSKDLNIDLDKYPNVKIYISLLKKGQGINDKKVIKEFTTFISKVKSILPYQQYVDLLNKSNNFTNIDNISTDLSAINKQYEITKKLNLENFDKFLTYLEFNREINPVELVKEESFLIDELFNKLGRTKYERDVAFLSKFVPTIKEYFTAEISADEYLGFEKEFNQFRTIWPNYFSKNIIDNLDKYKELLSKYHKNNIIRNDIFAKCIIEEKQNKNKKIINDKDLAIEQIKTNIGNKKIKLVVTGGFHTRGLEKIFERERVSYLIITPKVTQPIEQAKQIYLDTVIYYSNLLKNTINIEPLTQEPLNISFPKILTNILMVVQSNNFEGASNEQLKEAVKDFIDSNIIKQQSNFYGQVEILNWNIVNDDILNGKISIEVEYKDKANKSTISNIKYLYDNGEIVTYSNIDTSRTSAMLGKVTKNKYALPSIELEPTDRARKQISKYILKPLQDVIGTSVSLMPYKQLHMTVGYDSSEITQDEIDGLVDKADDTADIFSVTYMLGENFVNFKTSLSGTLKLMPDGVIIYEITDKKLIKEMMELRTQLKNSDEKYKTPSIVHMTIGRISDINLLQDTEQSKQELAILLEKLNEKIYEINKQNSLSKVKTSFNLKSGYVSSIGDKDYVVKQVFPKIESLVLFKNLFNKVSKNIDTIYKIVVAPIVEEICFRYIPFVITGLVITSPSLVIPSIITAIVGIVGFSFAHTLADKITNQQTVRNWKNFIVQSSILTGVYLTISLAFPQITFLAPIVTIVLHSINNIFSIKGNIQLLSLLSKDDNYKQDDESLAVIDEYLDLLCKELAEIVGSKQFDYVYDKQKEVKEKLEQFISNFKSIENMSYETKKEQSKEKLLELLELVSSCRGERFYFSINDIYISMMIFASYLDDVLFDKVFDTVLFDVDNNGGSSRFLDIMMSSAKYLLSDGKIEKVHKILDYLYQNKKKVKYMTDYGLLALPLPSPFDKKYSTINEWEDDIYQIVLKDKETFPVWYNSMIEVFLLDPGENSKYAYSIIRALYKANKIKEPLYLESRKKGYDWTIEFYKACGVYEQYCNVEKSLVLFEKEETTFNEDITLSEFISKLGYLKIIQSENTFIQSQNFDSVIETLRDSLNLSKKQQIQVLKEQINIIYKELFENKEINFEILTIFAPLFVLLNKENTNITLLEDICNRFIEEENNASKTNLEYREISYIYMFNKEKALSIVGRKFKDTLYSPISLYEKTYGKDWKTWSPTTIEEARKNVPEELQKVIFEYKDLELFYNAIGVSFDLIDEESKLYDRQEYVSEYKKLLSFIPNFILNIKHSRKYFRTLKKIEIKESNITKEQNLALDRILKNSDIALRYINNHDIESLKKSIEIIEKILEDFEIISEEFSKLIKISLNKIKEQLENGIINDNLTKYGLWGKGMLDKLESLYLIVLSINDITISQIKNISDKFEAYERVLENNELALSALTKMNENSINDTIYFIEEMVRNFELISPEFAQKAKISLLKIKNNIANGSVKIEDLAKLKYWNENNIDEINELHTLINAIHQTSTKKLMSLAMYSDNIGNGKEVVLREDGKDLISFYDCSKESIKKEMREFLINLSKTGNKFAGGWITKDNKLLYSKQLGYHGVNILVDMDEGIRVTFNDSGRGDGNAMRTTLLATLFAQAGFDITYVDTLVSDKDIDYGVCNFTAIYSVKDYLLAPEQYATAFLQAMEILSNTKDLDYHMEGIDIEYEHSYGNFYIPQYTLEDYRKMKNNYDAPKEFMKGGSLFEEWEYRINAIKRIKNAFNEQRQIEEQELSNIYEYLDFSNENKNSLSMVCEYVKGKLIVRDNKLEKNSNYDGIGDILSAVNLDVDESLRQAQVINLLDLNKLQFETEGYIGGMVAESGVLKLDNKGWLSIKVAVDRERKRAKFAFVEYVDFEGNRKKLDYRELVKILNENGYSVKEQKERSKSEKEASLKILREKILPSKDGIYMRGMGVSGQNDGYVPVNITYNKDNVGSESMWVVSYTSPEDVATIIRAKGLMTTGGGMLSHANITARENGKVAILSNGKWQGGKLELPYYSIESNIENKMGYEVQKISEHNIVLNEGDVVLANGITGRILLYDKIPSEDIYNIQMAIDTNDIESIAKYIQKYDDVEIIRQVIEYIFLQTVWDSSKNKITEFLLAWETDTEIGKKVEELNNVYVDEKLQDIKETILNVESIEDENIRYSMILKIEQELSTIRYSDNDVDALEELAQLRKRINKQKKDVIKKMYSNIQGIKKYSQEIFSKGTITQEEKDKLIKISEKAKVWNYYGSKELEDLISKIDDFIVEKEVRSVDYNTEIMGFESIKPGDIFRFGSKTTELAKMRNLFIKNNITNATVPYGIGISKGVLRIFIEKSGKGEQYDRLIKEFNKAITSNDKDLALSIGKEISKIINSIDNKELENLLLSKLEKGKRYAVRSSGVGEDGQNHAFAGMAKTSLNVVEEDVYKCVKEGWISFFTETCIEDMLKEGVVVQPALLIQEMVSNVAKAGVMFSRDAKGNLTEEVVLGLGEGLVSGRINPDHITLRTHDGTIDYRRALDNMTKIEEKAEGGTRVAKLTREEKIERIIDESMINKLKEIAFILEEDSGYPVDVEFAIDSNGNIFVLQRRAITTLSVSKEIDYSKYEQEVPEIEQSLIDNLLSELKGLSGDKSFNDMINSIKEKLSNLSDDCIEKYNTISEQINILYDEALNDISKGKSISPDYNYFLRYVYPFITFVKKQGSQEFLFSSFLQFILEGNFGEYKQNSAIENIIKVVVSVNQQDLKIIIDKLLEKGVIKYNEQAPDFIVRSLQNYDDLKSYYLQILKTSDIDKDLSKELKSFCKKMYEYNLSQKCNDILYEIDFLINKINSTTMPLLEYLMNDLLDNINDVENKESFIVNALLPLYKQTLTNNSINNRSLEKLFSVLTKVYVSKESPNDSFVEMFNSMLDIASVSQKDISKQISDFLAKIVMVKYLPEKEERFSRDKEEIKEEINEDFYNIFEIFASKIPNRTEIFDYLFGSRRVEVVRNSGKYVIGPGINEKTIKIFLKAVEKSDNKNISFRIGDSNIEDIDEVSSLLVDNFKKLDLVYLTLNFATNGEKGKELAAKIITKLLNLLGDDTLDSTSKKSIITMLVKMASSEIYCYIQEYNLFDIDKLNSLCKENNINLFLQPVSKSYVLSYEKNWRGEYAQRSLEGEYSFTPLMQMLPQGSVEESISFVQEMPILYTSVGTTDVENSDVKIIVEKFNVLQNILNYNNIVLSLIDGLSSSKNQQKDFDELIKILQEMITSLEFINEKHGVAARIALNNILNKLASADKDDFGHKKEIIFKNSMIRRLVSLKQWNTDNIADIKEIHTLINAIHQTSISDFKDTIDDITKIGDNLIKTVSATHQNPQVGGGFSQTGAMIYDLSKYEINPNIIDFIGKLSQKKLPYPRAVDKKPDYQINDFICKDNLLVWTTRLFAHSVDIFMDFSDSDRGITIAYHESGRKDGNAQRIEYFSTILRKLGFNVEADTKTEWEEGGKEGVCSLKAVLNRDFGLNDDVDMTDIATEVISLFKYSDMLDWDLEKEKNTYDFNSYKRMFDKLIEKFMVGDIWYRYNPNSQSGWNGNLTDFPERKKLDVSVFKTILENLGLVDELPRFSVNQVQLDTAFNDVVERAFAVGRLVLDENGKLKKNEDYDIISYLAKAIAANEEESMNNSRLINLLPKYKLNFRTVGYIGDLIAISGYLKLKDGNYLSVKGLINPITKRMKYSNVEYVTKEGRKNINTKELRKILVSDGFDIHHQEWINKFEQKRISKLLHRKVQMIDSPEIRGVSTSGADGTYKMGFVTTDRNKVDENSVFVTAYTTPDDIERIKTAKAIITTGGGVLSHAAITTREYKKPSVIINGTSWNDGQLNISYYSPLGTPFELDGLNIRKISEEKTILKEGTRVLVNGETGHVLSFSDVDSSILETLQEALEADDAQLIKQLFINYSDNKDIRKIVEYVYFQTIGNSSLQNTLDILFSSDMPQNIKDKIKELNEGYIQDKIKNIEEGISNLQRMSNPNLMYSIVEMLKDKLDFIKTPDEREDIRSLKNMVLTIREEVKDDLYKFIDNLINESQEYIDNPNLSIKELNRAIDIVQQSMVYEMFVAEKEERQDLQEIKVKIKEVVEQLDKKIKEYSTKQNKYKNQILSFDEIQGFDVHRFGSKTTELAKMFRLLKNRTDAIVPAGVGVSSNVLDVFIESIGKKQEYNILYTTFEQAVRDKDLKLAKELAEQIKSLIESGKKELESTKQLREELLATVDKTLGDKHYSVRSSGVGEDSANNAFAGMGETVLNVSKDNLYDALLTCWESFYSERSVEYMVNSNQIVKPAVLVQEMIDVDKAGVIFSRDKYGNATIETLYGLGEGIVSGKLTPDTITVDMSNGEVLEYSVATKEYKIISTQEGVERVPVEFGSKERTLDYDSIRHLTEIVNILEKDSGYKLDIEFGIKDGKIYILQRRPITTNDQVQVNENEDGVFDENIEEETSQIKHKISLISGTDISDKEVFVNIANPLSPTESIPVYLKAVNSEITEFIVDSKYEELVRSEVLGKLLLSRINKDIAVLDKFNGGLFGCKAGEIELLPVLDDKLEQTEFVEQSIDMSIDNVRKMLASA